MVLKMGLKYCLDFNLFPLILEIDSFFAKHVLDGSLEITWDIVMEIRRIHALMKGWRWWNIHLEKETRWMILLLTNFSSFAVTNRLIYSIFQELPREENYY